MKTIKQLEKEIEDETLIFKSNVASVYGKKNFDDEQWEHYSKLNSLKAKLQTIKEVLKKIDEEINQINILLEDMKDTPKKRELNCIKKRWTQEEKVKDIVSFLQELKQKIKGK